MNTSNHNSSDQKEEESRPHQSDPPSEIAGSPGSHSNSTSSERRQRIVVLLQDNNESSAGHQPADWTIRREFYDMDLAENTDDDDLSTEGDDEITDYEPRHDSDDIIDEVDGEFHESDGEYRESEDDELNGYVIEPDDNDDRSTTESGDDSDDAANYDTTLPASHQYLGDNLEESRGRQVLIEDSTISLPLINLSHVVLFPGQVLPVTTSNLSPRINNYLKDCIKRSSLTVGIISDPHSNQIGTTAEIRNHSMHGESLKVIMEGRQRFKLLSPPFDTAIEGDIRILPEVTLGNPYPCTSSLLKFLTSTNTPRRFIISKHPYWVLKHYEARNVMLKIMEQIKSWCSPDSTKDPNNFSYWVASNLPISNGERMKALSFSCTEARLMWLLAMLQSSEVFGCSGCKNVICYKKDVFLMSQSGPQCSYVNLGGYIHDTLTVRQAKGLIQEYGWSKEYSWFPGYAWRMAHCDNCNRHIGWCYKHIEADTKPKRFFGLSRANVRLQSAGERTLTMMDM